MKNAFWIAAATLSIAGMMAAFNRPDSAPNGSTAPVKPGPASSASPAADAMQIFAERCASKKCHGGESPKKKMDLSSAASVKATAINVDADENSALKRILPGKPEESYLFLKITKSRRSDTHLIKWKQMPPDSDMALDEKQIAVIEAWIKSLS